MLDIYAYQWIRSLMDAFFKGPMCHSRQIDCIWWLGKCSHSHSHVTHSLVFSIDLGNITHWGRMAHICVSKLNNIGSKNGSSPFRHQAIIWTNVRLTSICILRTVFSEILSTIHTFIFTTMHVKMSSAKWRPFCLGFNWLVYSEEEMTNIFMLSKQLCT